MASSIVYLNFMLGIQIILYETFLWSGLEHYIETSGDKLVQLFPLKEPTYKSIIHRFYLTQKAAVTSGMKFASLLGFQKLYTLSLPCLKDVNFPNALRRFQSVEQKRNVLLEGFFKLFTNKLVNKLHQMNFKMVSMRHLAFEAWELLQGSFFMLPR